MKPIKHQPSPYLYALTGLLCLMTGIGLGRFGYTTLLPFMVSQDHLSTFQAGSLGTFNFLGYFFGAASASPMLKKFGGRPVILSALAFCSISLFACAISQGIYWDELWRFIAGFTGAILMVCTPAYILKHIPSTLKSKINSILFAGVGIGIIISALITPYIHQLSTGYTWDIYGI